MSDEIVTLNEHPEARLVQAKEIVKRNILWSAGAGLLPIPWVELVAITVVELKLVKELADLYGTPFRKDLAKASIASLIGGLGSVAIGKALAVSSLRLIPVLGPVVVATSLSAVAAGVTYAIGKVFISHFEAGGTLLDFDPVKSRDFFCAEYANGVSQAAKVATADAGSQPAAA
jgi:uncharacterized protein (DUF697 family)